MPGRNNETWFKAEREGVYYGQCSKICGKDHAFMPIAFRVVSEDAYKAWLADAKKKFAAADGATQFAARRRRAAALSRTDRLNSAEHLDFGKQPWTTLRSDDATTTSTAIRPAGGAICSRPTTRTSARSI